MHDKASEGIDIWTFSMFNYLVFRFNYQSPSDYNNVCDFISWTIVLLFLVANYLIVLPPLFSRIGQPSPLLGNQSPRTPTSPWMPFSMFVAITTKLPSLDIGLFTTHYEVFKVIISFDKLLFKISWDFIILNDSIWSYFQKWKISRNDLVKTQRQIIGDKLLVSIILRLEH